MQQTQVTGRTRDFVIAADRFAFWFAQHWLGVFVVFYGIWVLAPRIVGPIGVECSYEVLGQHNIFRFAANCVSDQ